MVLHGKCGTPTRQVVVVQAAKDNEISRLSVTLAETQRGMDEAQHKLEQVQKKKCVPRSS